MKPRCAASCWWIHSTGVMTAGTGQAGNMGNVGSLNMHKGRVRDFDKNSLQKKLAKCSV